MDQDQFGGRTDDDLFSDDIEPVDETVTLSAPVPTSTSHGHVQIEPEPEPELAPAPAPAPSPLPAAHQPAPAPKPARSSLAQSRHNPTVQQNKPSRPAPGNINGSHRSKPPQSEASDTPLAADASPPKAGPKQPPTGPREPSAPRNSNINTNTPNNNNNKNNNNNNNNNTPNTSNNTPPTNTPPTTTPTPNTASAVSTARLNSGANPRQKLTDAELAARMEKMRLLAAEKTRRFEEAQRDEAQHAVAYARGMEEARKRRAEEAARRKVEDEERRKLEEERARNRERKLRALEGKEREGVWDLGRDVGELEGGDDEGRRRFRGAHGGVRGVRGLGGSRFAGGGGGGDGVDEGGEYVEFGLRGRGGGFRGRGVRGRGRGGGRLFDEREGEYGREQARPSGPAPAPRPPKKADLKSEDFPALPSSTPAPKKIDTAWAAKPVAAEMPISPPVGKWDEEVAASLAANQT